MKQYLGTGRNMLQDNLLYPDPRLVVKHCR